MGVITLKNSLLSTRPKPVVTCSTHRTLSPNLFFLNIYILFLEGEGKGKEREKNSNVWLLPMHPSLGTWPKTQACALTGNRTSNPLVRRPSLNPLSYISQGSPNLFSHTSLWYQRRNFCLFHLRSSFHESSGSLPSASH